VLVARVSNKSICIPITLCENKKDREPVELEALLNSGAGGLFIDATFAKQNEFTLHDLPEPLNAYNVDGTLNKKGIVMSYVKADLQVNGRIKPIQLYVTGLGKQKVILGFPWLQDKNPDVNWKTGEIRWKEQERRKLGRRAIELTRARLAKQTVPALIVERKKFPPATVEDAEEQEEDRTRNPLPDWYPSQTMIITAKEQKKFEEYARSLLANPSSRIHQQHKKLNINYNDFDIGQIEFDIGQNEFDDDALLISYINGESSPELEDVWINSTMSHSQAFAQKYEGNPQDNQIDLKDAIPPQFHEYLDVFSDEKATCKGPKGQANSLNSVEPQS
jgi:hypothetical protein